MRIFHMAAAALILGLAGCGPAEPPASEPAAAPAPDLGLTAQAGTYYSDFIKIEAMARYAPEALGLDEAQRARFDAAMQVETPASLPTGGGATALTFLGCRAQACPEGIVVVAVDATTGEPFVAVADEQGETVLVANDKLQALLEATSPRHSWTDPVRYEGTPRPAQP